MSERRWECNTCGRLFLMRAPFWDGSSCGYCGEHGAKDCREPREHTPAEVAEDARYQRALDEESGLSEFTYTAEMSDQVTAAMEQALKEWDEGVVWVVTTRRFADGRELNVKYAPSEFAYKFGDRVAAALGGRTYD